MAIGNSSIDGVPDLLPKYADINVAAGASGAGAELVAAVAGKKIRVLGYVLNTNVAGTVEFRSDETTGTLTGIMTTTIGGSIVAPYSRAGWFETVAGEPLDLTTVTCTADGHLIYCEI